ncbi:hypothetical protein BH09VER1_BH09VER1_17890 [soil metagenome]
MNQSMDFPDLPHLRKLQADLWNWPRSRAALMVGAGMSLNAEALPGSTSSFPTWRELVRALFDELHPRSLADSPEERKARDVRFSGTNTLRIASEYEAAFGRQKLDHLILEKNPDAFHRPGRLHKLLLQLPWVDVFTTNYDTLLERTEVSNRAYQPVTKASELTSAYAPRIIKLHGSFPSQTPFVITEEDYRTYPRKASPFINSVRQSLLENSIVLLGFSGDDPNFLEWSGWIRDELGNEHAPIYLVGALNLRQPDRALLTQRGITPIDVSPVLAGRKYSQGEPAAALEWFLSSLISAKMPRPEKWPDTTLPTVETSDACPPIYSGNREIPPPVDLAATPPIPLDKLQATINRWKFERLNFPGWLVLAEAKRSEIWLKTKYWIPPLVEISKGLETVQKLLLLREINWRLEIAFVPLFSDILEHYLGAFQAGFNELQVGNQPLSSLMGTESIREAWFEVGFAILREARETYSSDRWTKVDELLGKCIVQEPRFKDRYTYEKILLAMWNLQYDKAKSGLAEWQPSRQDPLAGMWKAGLLAEIDEIGESRSLLRSTLSEIRGALRNQGNNIELLSLEGWCTYLIAGIETSFDVSKHEKIREEFWERWQELKAWDCSPWPHKEYFDEALEKSLPSIKSGETITRGFDLGHSSRTYNWKGDVIDDYLPAFGRIRLYEQAGIPMRLRGMNLGSEALTNACCWISPFIPFWSPALLVRAGLAKEFKESKILARPALSSMKIELVERLYRWCLDVFSEQLEKVTGFIVLGSVQESVIECLAEIISRVCLRANQEQLRATFPVAVSLFTNRGIRYHIRLHEAANPLFRRLFSAADDELLLQWLPSLLRLPLFDDVEPSAIPSSYRSPDAMRHFPTGRVQKAEFLKPELTVPIHKAVSWLMIRIGSEEGEARQRALTRLTQVCQAKLMTADQRDQFGGILWERRNKNGLADLEHHAMFGLFHLPVPKDIPIVDLIKNRLLSMPAKGIVSYDDNGKMQVAGPGWSVLPFLFETSLASKPILQLRGDALGEIVWTPDESRQLYLKIRTWWENDKVLLGREHEEPVFSFGKAPVQDTSRELGKFLRRAVLPKAEWFDNNEWESLFGWITELRELGIFANDVLPYILLHRSERAGEFEEVIKNDIHSGLPDATETSVVAVRHWLHLAEAEKIPKPDPSLLAAIIERFIFRRKEGIEDLCSELTFLIVDMPSALADADMRTIGQSLVSWDFATALHSNHDVIKEFSNDDCPDLRFHVARLAGAMEQWFKGRMIALPEQSGVHHWKKLCENDAFPEIRRAFRIFGDESAGD